MIQKMFGFLPNGDPQTSTVSTDDSPIYDTPPRAPRPIVIADNSTTSTQSQPATTSTPSVQTSTRPTPVARVRSSRNTYVDFFIFSLSPRHNLSFGSRAFRISAPKIWNCLTPHIQQSQTLSSFRRHLRTHYFQSAYPAP